MKYLAMAVALSASTGALAQAPVIQSNTHPVPTATCIYRNFSDQGYLPIGMNQYWGFVSAWTTPGGHVNYADTVGQPGSWGFPAANLTSSRGPLFDRVTYMQVDTSGIYVLGYWNGVPYIHQDPYKWLQYPVTYGDAWTDTLVDWSGSMSIFEREANAYGTLAMPWGTVDDVLLVQERYEWADTVGGVVESFLDIFGEFYANGYLCPVATMYGFEWRYNGVLVDAWIDMELLETFSVGSREHPPAAGTLEVFPVPARDLLHIAVDEGAITALTVMDATGRLVMNVPVPTQMVAPLTLDIRMLRSGNYMVHASTGDRVYRARFIVE